MVSRKGEDCVIIKNIFTIKGSFIKEKDMDQVLSLFLISQFIEVFGIRAISKAKVYSLCLKDRYRLMRVNFIKESYKDMAA